MSALEHNCTAAEPSWHKDGDLLACGACGARQSVNPQTGNLVWMRAGRVVAAAQDLADARRRHDERWG